MYAKHAKPNMKHKWNKYFDSLSAQWPMDEGGSRVIQYVAMEQTNRISHMPGIVHAMPAIQRDCDSYTKIMRQN